MNFSDFVIRDFYQVRAPEHVSKLKKREKFQLMDMFLNVQDPSKRGLKVTLDISHGGRRINNRIYPPNGQRDGVSTWLEPFPKALITHHQRDGEPIGRLSDVRHVSIEDAAMRFFPTVQAFMDFRTEMESGDAVRIYNAMRDTKLLTNDAWPGLTRLEADVRVTDETAIEKFLDQRYMTFSAGTTTDKYCCGLCGQNWVEDGICEHMPGMITEDGDIGTIVTGTFIGRELSVVNEPADSLSMVRSIEFADSKDDAPELSDVFNVDPHTIYITDARLNSKEGDLAMPKATQPETEVPPTVENADNTGAIVELMKEVRDALVALQPQQEDETDAQEHSVQSEDETQEEVVEQEDKQEEVADAPDEAPDNQELIDQIVARVLEVLKPEDTSVEDSKDDPCDHNPCEEDCPEKKPEQEEVSEDYKQALLLVDEKTSELADMHQRMQNVLDVLAKQHKKNFSDVEDSARLDTMYEWFVNIDPTDAKDSQDPDVSDSPALTPVESPASAPDSTLKDNSLSSYQKGIVDQYNKISDEVGQTQAEWYLRSQSRYLPSNFHPKNFS